MEECTPPKKMRQRFRDEDLTKLQKALTTGQQRYEPKNTSKSMKAMVAAVREDIIQLRERGYTVSVIADMVRDGGFDHLTPSTLCRYISEASARKRRRKRSGTTNKVTRPSTPPLRAPSTAAQSSPAPRRRGEFTPSADCEDL